MAITPQELVLDSEELSRLELLESEIDAQLRRRFKPTSARTEVLVGSLTERLNDEIMRRYRNLGWKVEQGFSPQHLSFRV